MTIGDMLFTRLSIQRMDGTASEIAALQERISLGTNDPRPSADPARAASLSAARDQQTRLAAFQANAETAASRLDLTGTALSAMSAQLRQVRDIALQAASATTGTGSLAALRAELDGLKEALLATANSVDTTGQPLFAGLSGGVAFVQEGTAIRYAGDGGHLQVQLSETLRVPTGLNGAEVLMAVPGEAGPQSVFTLIDDLAAALAGAAGADGLQADEGLIAGLGAAVDHLADQQGRAGAWATQVARQSDRLDARRLAVDKAVAGLNDLDLTAAATRLSALMTAQQASMQTYAMVTRQTLFDLIG